MSLITEDDLKREIRRLEQINRSLKKNLLDEFAKAALTGYMSSSSGATDTIEFLEFIRRDCYEIAAQMLKAREAVCVPTP